MVKKYPLCEWKYGLAVLRLCSFIQYPILCTIQDQEAIKTHCVFYCTQFSAHCGRPGHVTLKLETGKLIKFSGSETDLLADYTLLNQNSSSLLFSLSTVLTHKHTSTGELSVDQEQR